MGGAFFTNQEQQSGGRRRDVVVNYTEGFRARMIERLAGPDAISASALAKEVGVSQNTLSRWLRDSLEAVSNEKPLPPARPDDRTRRP